MRRLVALLAVAACGDGKPELRTPYEESRVRTAGRDLLDLVPARADVVLEVDVARLRANATLGPMLATIAEAGARASEGGKLGFEPLRDVDLALAAVYRAGRADASTLFLVRGEALDASAAAPRVPEAQALDAHTLAVGPVELRDQVVSLARHRGKPLSEDGAFLRLRDAAMPARAPGAAVRLTARLDRDGRIGAAGRLGLDELPASLSVWIDVADDAAGIALLGADGETEAKRFADGVMGARQKAARAIGAMLGGAELFDKLRVEAKGKTARVIWTLGPKAFARWADGVKARFSGGKT